MSEECRAFVFSSACLHSLVFTSFPQLLSVGSVWMISNYHWTCRASGANYGFMITCRLPSHQSDKHSNGVLAEPSPTCLFPPPLSILSFVLSWHRGRGKTVTPELWMCVITAPGWGFWHISILNLPLSSPSHRLHSSDYTCLFCIRVAVRKCQNVWERTALKLSQLNIISYVLN